VSRADSDLQKGWDRSGPRRPRFRLPTAWNWQHDPGGGHFAGAIMIVIGLIGLAAGHWEFGAFMVGLGAIFLLMISFVAHRFGRRRNRRN
jgi:multisubunit Na+/H+ antiporter MnhG subunit